MMGGCIHGTERDHRCYRCEPVTPAEKRQQAADDARWTAGRERRLREKAMECLRDAVARPYPAQEINFTVRDKLIQFGYAFTERRPSPYKAHRPGTMVDFLVPTEAGIRASKDPRP